MDCRVTWLVHASTQAKLGLGAGGQPEAPLRLGGRFLGQRGRVGVSRGRPPQRGPSLGGGSWSRPLGLFRGHGASLERLGAEPHVQRTDALGEEACMGRTLCPLMLPGALSLRTWVWARLL